MREEQDDNISVEDMDEKEKEKDRDSETLLEIAIRCMINS